MTYTYTVLYLQHSDVIMLSLENVNCTDVSTCSDWRLSNINTLYCTWNKWKNLVYSGIVRIKYETQPYLNIEVHTDLLFYTAIADKLEKQAIGQLLIFF